MTSKQQLQWPSATTFVWLLMIVSISLLGCGGDWDADGEASTIDSTSAKIRATAPGETPPPAKVTADPAPPQSDTVTPVDGSNSSSPTAVIVVEEPAAVLVPAESTSPTANDQTAAADSLEEQLAAFTVPPAWLESTESSWDTSVPWDDARQEIRTLLGKGDDASRREGLKLTWVYLQKGDIGNGHEYGMYMFLGREPLWAIHVYREWLAKTDHGYPPYFGIRALASLYAEYGQFEQAVPLLERGLQTPPPDPKWTEMRQAEMHDAFGDLYAAWGRIDDARTSYQEAMRLFPLSKPPYGRHLLPRRAKKVQSKLDLLSKESLKGTTLRDGHYKETALGYSGDVKLTIQVQGGRITDIGVQHEEKIDQNACVLIPEQIVRNQSFQVDSITGATVTRDAILAGTLRALQQAGLK
ncbi:MAG: FMN-binding protein [Fuerstiella sp.]|nr:FMN-binding protein [Fuerstiella sp.]